LKKDEEGWTQAVNCSLCKGRKRVSRRKAQEWASKSTGALVDRESGAVEVDSPGQDLLHQPAQEPPRRVASEAAPARSVSKPPGAARPRGRPAKHRKEDVVQEPCLVCGGAGEVNYGGYPGKGPSIGYRGTCSACRGTGSLTVIYR
jgi:hypothetical protein